MQNSKILKLIERPMKTTDTGVSVFDNVIRLPTEDSGQAHSIVRIANCHIGRTFTRRTPVIIRNLMDSKKSTIRYVMGNGGSVVGLTKNSVALDYDAICELGVQYKQPVQLVVRKATLLESLRWLMYSPDLNVRLNTRFAVLGAALGFLGLCLSILA